MFVCLVVNYGLMMYGLFIFVCEWLVCCVNVFVGCVCDSMCDVVWLVLCGVVFFVWLC